MFNDLDAETTGMINPIFKFMGKQGNMGSPIIEQEIQNHKNKLNNLISKLITILIILRTLYFIINYKILLFNF